eukprot:441812_1
MCLFLVHSSRFQSLLFHIPNDTSSRCTIKFNAFIAHHIALLLIITNNRFTQRIIDSNRIQCATITQTHSPVLHSVRITRQSASPLNTRLRAAYAMFFLQFKIQIIDFA